MINFIQRIKKDITKEKWALLGLAIYFLVAKLLFNCFCIFRILTGLPCPGCGMTRAAALMLTGHFSESFRMHPMALPWIVFVGYCIIRRYIMGKRVTGSKTIVAVLVVGLICTYMYRMFTLFPEQAPMTYEPIKLNIFQLFD